MFVIHTSRIFIPNIKTYRWQNMNRRTNLQIVQKYRRGEKEPKLCLPLNRLLLRPYSYHFDLLITLRPSNKPSQTTVSINRSQTQDWSHGSCLWTIFMKLQNQVQSPQIQWSVDYLWNHPLPLLLIYVLTYSSI